MASEGRGMEGKMAARIVIVHDDNTFRDPLVTSLIQNGHEVVAFEQPTPAWDALATDNAVDVLITRVRFPVGNPHGVALAQWAHTNHRQIQVLFVAAPEMQAYIDGLGVLVPTPTSPTVVVDTVTQLLVSGS